MQVREDRLPEGLKRKGLAVPAATAAANRRQRRRRWETDHDAVRSAASTHGTLPARDGRYASNGADAGQA